MDYKIIELTEFSLWEEELSDIPHSYYHTWEYANAFNNSSEKNIFLLLISDRITKMACVLSKRRKLEGYTEIFSPYGFGGIIIKSDNNNNREIYETWLKFANENNFVTAFILQHPLLDMKKYWIGNEFEYHKTYSIKLTNSLETLWKNLKRNHRHEIKKLNENTNIEVSSDKNLLFQYAGELYSETIQRVGANNTYSFSSETLDKLCFSPNALMLGTIISGKVHAIILILYTNKIAEYFLNAVSSEGRNSTKLLLWKAIEILKIKKVEVFHLGGGIKPNDKLADFKRRFGGEENHSTIVKEVFDQEKYQYLCDFYNCSKDITNGYFPSYWQYT